MARRVISSCALIFHQYREVTTCWLCLNAPKQLQHRGGDESSRDHAVLPKLAGTTTTPACAVWWERHPLERGQGLHHSYHLGNLQPSLLGYPRVLVSY